MAFLTNPHDVVEGAGILRGLWEFSSRPVKKLWRKFQDSPTRRLGYIVRTRHITARYETRTAGTISHEIEMVATRDFVDHYHGRYLVRSGHNLRILTPHKAVNLDPKIEMGFQKFTVQLSEPLKKDQSARIIMINDWKDPNQEKNPEIPMVVFCQTKALQFSIHFPEGTNINEEKGHIQKQAGEHAIIFTEMLRANHNLLIWQPENPREGLTYRVTWAWI